MNYGGGFDMGPSQFAGGGFVPMSSPAGGMDAGFGGGQKGGGSRPLAQTMRDVTVRQLLRENTNGADDQFKVDGIELTMFFIVGRIVGRQESSTDVKLKIDDGTGVIEVTHYTEDANELINMTAQDWVPNTYVRVCGNMRMLNNKKSMMAFRIKVIKDFNEITYHNLQCIFQHLHLTKGVAPPAAAPQSFGTTPSLPVNQAPAPTSFPGSSAPSQLCADILAVYHSAEAVASPHGFSLDQVLGALQAQGHRYTMAQVQDSVDFMSNEGQLYSTVDDQHHKSTAMA